MKTKSYLQFDFCFSDPNSEQVVRFDLDFVWRCDAIVECEADRQGGGTRFSDHVLSAESQFVTEDWDQCPLFQCRFTKPNGYGVRLWTGRDRFHTRVVSLGSGGNMYWTSLTVPPARSIHLLNWLRRRPGLTLSEWDSEFRDRIWSHRGSLQLADLRGFARKYITDYAKGQRAAALPSFS